MKHFLDAHVAYIDPGNGNRPSVKELTTSLEGDSQYQRYRNGESITGATGKTYMTTEDDVATLLTFGITPASLGGYYGISAISDGITILATETGEVDSGSNNTGDIDTGVVDTGVVDTGVVDTGVVDTGVVDTGVVDTGVVIHNNDAGGAPFTRDNCPVQRDCSSSYYDNICGPCSLVEKLTNSIPFHGAADTVSIQGSSFSQELNNSYLRAYSYRITTIPTIQGANIKGVLTRKDMAKMMSNFALNVMGKDVSHGAACTFSDLQSLSKETQYYAMVVCRLGLMGYANDGVTLNKNFYPDQEVDRAQFGTILSRLLRGEKYNGGMPYYQKHLAALKLEGIMTQIQAPHQEELRGRVMLMLYRIFKE
ncbi:MAG: hypothetical protein NTX91_04695 [candidate division SR1 bacterium]|nr:hypothetical protein [candidate division SR1 bacterium]